MPNISWNAADYKENFSFVPAYREAMVSLITKQPGSRVIDLGCGNGSLTEKNARRGYLVTGIDDSEEMLRLAQKEHPGLKFLRGNAVTFHLKEQADVVFSNAVFHWIDERDQQTMLSNIYRNLKQGGELRDMTGFRRQCSAWCFSSCPLPNAASCYIGRNNLQHQSALFPVHMHRLFASHVPPPSKKGGRLPK